MPGQSGYPLPSHTAEYTEAYGPDGAPSAYPVTEQYWSAPPPPNATRELPTYDSQWANYGQGYGDQWQAAAAPPGATPPGALPPGLPPQDEPPEPPRRNVGLWLAIGLGVVLLIGAIAVIAGVFVGGKDSSTSADGPSAYPSTSSRNYPGLPPRTGSPDSGQPGGPPGGLPGLPGQDDPGLGGTAMGTITANDGTTLTLDSLSGQSSTVHTDDRTQVISLTGSRVSDLQNGDMVLVQGDKASDGSIQAKIIISTALSGGER
ncbi:DUF5666 domain-containing protein [Nocardia callitridis]|uniref:DUF5666 domain-containing protein n=1 Tax=Nocardia callitridis TaxID=648753 RepID=UPI003CD0A27C